MTEVSDETIKRLHEIADKRRHLWRLAREADAACAEIVKRDPEVLVWLKGRIDQYRESAA